MSSSSNQITIQSLKDEVPPQSPKKYEGTQCCAVVTKSPLKSTCYGKMFSMNLCGKDSCTTIQAVCFDDSMFEEFKAKQSYDVESFRLKKGFGTSSNEVEVLIDHSTSVEESPDQFAVEKKCFNIAAILRKESQVFHFIDITAKVISIGDICVIKKTLDNIEKRDVELADESGVITMVLWRQRAENFNFKVNDVLHLENMVTTIFNNKVMLSTTFESSMVKVEEDIKVPAIEKLQSQKRSLISTSETSVLAVKDFKAAYKCLSCKADIQPRKTGSDALITCPTCSTSFLACTGSISSECMVLLSCDHQWYSANTGVSSNLISEGEGQSKFLNIFASPQVLYYLSVLIRIEIYVYFLFFFWGGGKAAPAIKDCIKLKTLI